jgi:hypothetical protein
LKEEHTLEMPENETRRKIFGTSKNVVRGSFRILHKEDRFDLYRSLSTVATVGWACSLNRETKNAYIILAERLCHLEDREMRG